MLEAGQTPDINTQTANIPEADKSEGVASNEDKIIETRIPFDNGEIVVRTTETKILEAYTKAAETLKSIQFDVILPEVHKAPQVSLRESFDGHRKKFFGSRRSLNGNIEINLGRIADFVSEPDKSISVDMGQARPTDTDTKVLLFKRLLNIIFLHEIRHSLEAYEPERISWKKGGESVNATLLSVLTSKPAISALAIADISLSVSGINDSHLLLLIGSALSLFAGKVIAPVIYKNSTSERDARSFSLEQQDLNSPFDVEYLEK